MTSAPGREIAQMGYQTCPCSKALKSDIDVTIAVV
ncbi:hypothetical protein AWB82_02911 [Caballeronia glebae]|uniref:Uncharacterized protein n=1 Tax=Caballeronia glebae TaxID=1777143 RepID=A0A158ASX5_9BURK|nr:hypothetical protein AWB82_02911 [Caballeronia glebae]